jgi:signal transduction histidine kinase/DNA-binding response OmpR family regulator
MNRGKRIQLRSKVVLGFVLASFLVISVSVITFFSIRNLLDTVENLSEPNEKLRQLNGLVADIYLLDVSKTERTSDKDSVLEETLERIKNRLEWFKSNTEDEAEMESFENISMNISELMVVYAGLEEVRYNLTSRTFSEEALKNIERSIKRQQEQSEMEFLGRVRQRDFLSEISGLGKESSKPIGDRQESVRRYEDELLEIFKDYEEEQLKLDSAETKPSYTETTLEALRSFMAEMYQDEQKLQEEFVFLETKLIDKNKEVFSEVQGLISSMQRELLVEYRAKNQSAYDLTYTVSIILSILVFLGIIGSLGFIYSILNEVKKANTYRRQLEEAKIQSENLAKAKQDFLANMSHEIRNPLHAIQGYQQAIQKSKLNKQQEEFIKMIGFASETLLGIVNDILDFSKLEAGKIEIEKNPFDPNALFMSIKNFFSFKAEEKDLYFEWDIQTPTNKWFLGDSLRINQILNNLISNSIKFTRKGGVSVKINYTNNQELLIRVKDTGMGMTDKVKENIFREFDQGDTSITRQFGGTGLGLTIVNRLVELHGGKINVKSEVDKGTIIEILIPMETTEPLKKALLEEDFKNYDISGLRFLVVDDDKIGLKLIRLLLEAKGAKVETYQGGLQFKDEFKYENEYDLVILDIQMPEVSGIDVLKMLRGHQKYTQLQAVAVTANVFADEKNKLKDSGFNGLILKPFKEYQFVQKIGEILNLSIIESSKISLDYQEEKHNAIAYDLEDLKKFCMGDEEMLQEVIVDIVQTTRSDLTKLSEALSSNDFKVMREITHQLSSRLRQIKLTVGDKAKDIEVKLKNGKTEGIKSSVEDLIIEITASMEVLENDFEISQKA